MAWVAEFKDIKKSWPDSKAHCFCDKCRKLIQEMLQCEKCLGLKTNSAHVCGYFTKRFGIFMRTRTHKASILQLAALVAHGRSEEDAILELKAQLAEKEEAARTAAALEAELAQQQEKKRKADFQRTLAQRLHATRIKTEQEFSQKTGYQRHRQQIADTSNPSGSLDSGASRPAVVASMLAAHSFAPPGTHPPPVPATPLAAGTGEAAQPGRTSPPAREATGPAPATAAMGSASLPAAAGSAPEGPGGVAGDAAGVPADYVPPECEETVQPGNPGPYHQCQNATHTPADGNLVPAGIFFWCDLLCCAVCPKACVSKFRPEEISHHAQWVPEEVVPVHQFQPPLPLLQLPL